MKAKIAFFFFIFMFVSIAIIAQPGGGHPEQPWSYPAKAVQVQNLKPQLPSVPFFDATRELEQTDNPALWITNGYPYITGYNVVSNVWTMETTEYNQEYRFSVTVVGANNVKITYDKVTKLILQYNKFGTIDLAQILYITVNGNTYEKIGNFTHTDPLRVTVKIP